MVCKDTMRARIIEAAKKRFVHYGYAKTTMAEIAADLNMSPGNLYRYFPGKIDIAEAIADNFAEQTFGVLREVAGRTDLPPRERLRTYFHVAMETTFRALGDDPRIFEVAQFIKRERPHHINLQLSEERKIMGKILKDGVASGEFDIPDIAFTAEMMQSATLKFRYPQLWSVLPLDALKRDLDGVFDLIVNGIAARNSARAAARPAAARAGVGI